MTNYEKITYSVESLADYLIKPVDLDFGGKIYKSADGKFCETYEEAEKKLKEIEDE